MRSLKNSKKKKYPKIDDIPEKLFDSEICALLIPMPKIAMPYQ